MIEQNLSITPEYIISLIVVVLVISIILKKSPQINTFIVIVVGVLTGYLFLLIINFIFPLFNQVLSEMNEYSKYMILNKFNNMGYFHIFPPILFVFIIFIILLYNRNI